MKDELEQKLKQKYPKLLGKLPYFECGEGWYPIIDNMCYQIQRNFERKSKVNPEIEQPEFVQIKEKFGGLRAYTNGHDEYTDAIINMAESMSVFTCENCGNLGKTRVIGTWFTTYCQICADKVYKRNENVEAKNEEE